MGDVVLCPASDQAPKGEGGDGRPIGAGGVALRAELTNERGGRFEGKVDGLGRDRGDPHRAYFVVDMDDPDTPSELYEAELAGSWY